MFLFGVLNQIGSNSKVGNAKLVVEFQRDDMKEPSKHCSREGCFPGPLSSEIFNIIEKYVPHAFLIGVEQMAEAYV